MVKVALPPPGNPPDPLFVSLSPGTSLFRLFDPTQFGATALSFRDFGPLLRFDHHRTTSGVPMLDAERGVYYAGTTLSCCVVEVFGDSGLIDCGAWHIAMPRLTRSTLLMDLRGSGAMRADSVAALGKVPDHTLSQTWSRYFYETQDYQPLEGLLWYNAHNDEEAILLYERAEDALECAPDRILRLDDPIIRPVLEQIAEANNLTIVL